MSGSQYLANAWLKVFKYMTLIHDNLPGCGYHLYLVHQTHLLLFHSCHIARYIYHTTFLTRPSNSSTIRPWSLSEQIL